MVADFDFVVIGSGFGGSVSALRLAEKGYRVLVLEKGRRFAPDDFPANNMDVARWVWQPELGLRGIFQMSFLSHVTVMHGVGVGGGSLVYANTLPTPKRPFFRADSWAHLADWERELAPHYATAKRMLGAARYPKVTYADTLVRDIAKDLGRSESFEPTEVAVFFGEEGRRVPDPFFGGEGPERTGCTHCGACMTGCRVGAKNTLDKNYLYLAERLGVEVRPETEVLAVRAEPSGGYVVETKPTFEKGPTTRIRTPQVVFAGGVMGTLPLLLAMKEDARGLPGLSDRLGHAVRTNSEALVAIIADREGTDFTDGVAITSILHTDDHSHLEPVRYGPGSHFFRPLALPHAPGETLGARLLETARRIAKEPRAFWKAITVPDFARQTAVLLYMRTIDGKLRMRLGRSALNGFRRGLVTELPPGEVAPSAFMPEATELAERFAAKAGGFVMTLLTETLLGVPSTAHILGGCTMGNGPDEGVIDARHRVFGYPGLYVVDGSAISANPGVNPSLTITALAERAMSFVPAR